MKSKTARILFYSTFAVSICAAIISYFIYVSGPFRFSSVCERCGAIRYTTEWQFPGTRWTVLARSTESETPVSRTLVTNGIVTAHDHPWIFASGGGNGVKCALGRASQVQSSVESDDVARIIEALHKAGEHPFRDRVLTNLFGRDTTFFVRAMSPLNSTADSSIEGDLRQWVSKQSEYLDEAAARLK
jgi:hypothetical protein